MQADLPQLQAAVITATTVIRHRPQS